MENYINLPFSLFFVSLAVIISAFVFRKKLSQSLDRFSAKSKLAIIGFSSLFSLTSIIIMESIFMNKLNIEITSIAERDLPIIEKMTKAEFNTLESNIFFEKSVSLEFLDEPDKAEKYFQESDKMISKAENYLSDIIDDLKIFLDDSELEAERKEFIYLINGLENISKDLKLNHKEKNVFHSEIKELSKTDVVEKLERIDTEAIRIERELEEYLIHFEEFTEKSAQHAEHLEGFALNLTISLGFFLISFLVILVVFISRSISNPISFEARRIKEIAAPSLSRSQDCLKLSDDLTNSADEQLNSVTQTAASCEQITQTLEVNLKQTENCKLTSETAKSCVDSTLIAIEKLMSSVEELKKSDEKISKILQIVDTIKEKTAVIDEIVFQTKLLSFNASVEAERAGEHGRGFAVVASEVGNLARTSGKASLEISEILKESINEVGSTIDLNRKNINLASDELEAVLKESNELKRNIDMLSDANASIASASREQTVGVRQVNEAVLSISQHSNRISSNAKELKAISNEIVGYSDNLSSSANILSSIAFGTIDNKKIITRQSSTANQDKNIVKVDFKKEEYPLEPSQIAVGANDAKDKKGGWESI